jgi:hypothetical protein
LRRENLMRRHRSRPVKDLPGGGPVRANDRSAPGRTHRMRPCTRR